MRYSYIRPNECLYSPQANLFFFSFLFTLEKENLASWAMGKKFIGIVVGLAAVCSQTALNDPGKGETFTKFC